MREIKFRAWIKYRKEYIYIIGFCYEETTGIRLWYKINKEIVNESFGIDTIILEQYIGKKDKYDKDIYEGDITKVSHDLDKKGYSLFYIDTYLDFTGYVVSWENIKGYSCITHIIEEDYSNVEIINTVNETPELLEAK